jgi:hypothetical protein
MNRTLTPKTGVVSINTPHQKHISTLNVPIHVQYKGNLFNQQTPTVNHMMNLTHKYKNMLIGVIHSVETSHQHLGTSQSESSVVASIQHASGLFLETQLGYISTKKLSVLRNSGMRSQCTLGYDATHVTPFIQVLSRNLETHHETETFAGVELDFTYHASPAYSLTTSAVVKLGSNTLSGLSAALDANVSLHLNSGVILSTGLTVTRSNIDTQFALMLEH